MARLRARRGGARDALPVLTRGRRRYAQPLGPPGQLRLGGDAAAPLLGVHTRAAAASDPLFSSLAIAPGNGRDAGSINWVQAGRTLRTTTFRLESTALHYLVRGAGNVAVVVDGHRLVQGPLHGAVVKRIGEGGWRWVMQGLSTTPRPLLRREKVRQGPNWPPGAFRVLQSDPERSRNEHQQPSDH